MRKVEDASSKLSRTPQSWDKPAELGVRATRVIEDRQALLAAMQAAASLLESTSH